MPDSKPNQEVAVLRAEIETLLAERHSLLRATGAAAVSSPSSTATLCPNPPTMQLTFSPARSMRYPKRLCELQSS